MKYGNLQHRVAQLLAPSQLERQRTLREIIGVLSGATSADSIGDVDQRVGSDALSAARLAVLIRARRPPAPGTDHDAVLRDRTDALQQIEQQWPRTWSREAFSHAVQLTRFLIEAQNTAEGDPTANASNAGGIGCDSAENTTTE